MFRPSTAATSCSTGTAGTLWRNDVVLGVIANKGNEVGVCSCNMHTLEFTLMQYTDQPTLPVTLTLMHQLGVVEVLLPSTTLETEISKTLRRSVGDGVTFLSIPRRNFNELNGVRMIEHVASDASVTRELKSSSRYLSVAAAGAVLHYMEFLRKTSLAPRSVRVAYRCIKDRVGIDRDSCRLLELIAPDTTANRDIDPEKDAKAAKAMAARSLMKLVDQTLTQGGQRLLRSNVLMPVGNKRTIEDRLDSVEYLVKHSELRAALRRQLTVLQSDVDHLLSKFAYSAQALQDNQFVDTTLKHVLGLRGVVHAVPGLAAALQGCDTVLLRSVEKVFAGAADGQLEEVKTVIDAVIDTAVKQESRRGGSSVVTKTLHVYAVRSGIDGVLDVVRQEYSAALEDVYAMAGRLSHELRIPSLKITHKAGRGFLLTCAKAEMAKGGDRFILATHGKKNALFTTKELVSLNNKLRDVYGEIIQRSTIQIKQLVGHIRANLPGLFRVSEAISLLDMLQSFATHAGTRERHVRPTFGPALQIKGGRHPILEAAGAYVPNDTALPKYATFMLLTGPNMSGKTTYLLQVALITVMAHVGLFVPAEAAEVPLIDHVFTRLGTDDSIEQNASTFSLEMKDVAYVVSNATTKSLVVIDELGRGTGHDEGAAIAYAVAEALAKRQCLVFFATHYIALHHLARMRQNVANIHFSVKPEGDVLRPLYKIEEGTVSTSRYGLALAYELGLPEDVLEDARHLSNKLAATDAAPADGSEWWWFHVTADRALAACANPNLTDADVRALLLRLQTEVAAAGHTFASLASADLSRSAPTGWGAAAAAAAAAGVDDEPCTQLLEDAPAAPRDIESVSSATFRPLKRDAPAPLFAVPRDGASTRESDRLCLSSSGAGASRVPTLDQAWNPLSGAATPISPSDRGSSSRRRTPEAWSHEGLPPFSSPPSKRIKAMPEGSSAALSPPASLPSWMGLPLSAAGSAVPSEPAATPPGNVLSGYDDILDLLPDT